MPYSIPPLLTLYRHILLPTSHTHAHKHTHTHTHTNTHTNTLTHTYTHLPLTSIHLLPFLFILLSFSSSGTDRSIVSDVAGTTRDTVDALVVRYAPTLILFSMSNAPALLTPLFIVLSLHFLRTQPLFSNCDSLYFISSHTHKHIHIHTHTQRRYELPYHRHSRY